jgi:hypothetical protein
VDWLRYKRLTRIGSTRKIGKWNQSEHEHDRRNWKRNVANEWSMRLLVRKPVRV